MVIVGYFIHVYWWVLVVILLVVIDGILLLAIGCYFISGY